MSISLSKIDQFVTIHSYEAYSPKKLSEKARTRLQRSLTGHRKEALRPFLPPYTGQIHARSVARTLFGQFHKVHSRKLSKLAGVKKAGSLPRLSVKAVATSSRRASDLVEKSDKDISGALSTPAESGTWEWHLLILRKPVAPRAAPAAFPAFGRRGRRQHVAARGCPARRRNWRRGPGSHPPPPSPPAGA